MEKAKARGIPIVLDADGLWHLATNPSILQGYTKAVITPNAMEFSRLVKSVLKRESPPTVTPDPQLVQVQQSAESAKPHCGAAGAGGRPRQPDGGAQGRHGPGVGRPLDGGARGGGVTQAVRGPGRPSVRQVITQFYV